MENDHDLGELRFNSNMLFDDSKRTEDNEKSQYEAMRAGRRARSKATLIGLFSKALENLCNLKTISGLDDKFNWLEYYRELFCDALTSLGLTSDDDYSKILSQMNGYSSVCDFLYDVKDQKAELAAFGLILYDRLTSAESEKMSHSDIFLLHEELNQCEGYLEDLESTSTRAKAAVLAKLAKDPKQAEKAKVRECWELWRKEPDRYKGKAAFARDMLNKFESLASQRVIERWCKEWESVPT